MLRLCMVRIDSLMPKRFLTFLTLFTIISGTAAAAPAITTYHYDNWRTGWNQKETILTPANVGNLQLQVTVALDEQVDAQPLYVPNLTIAGGKHDVVYVVTANDTVYAIDAASGQILVQNNFGPAVPVAELPAPCGNNSDVLGISSTPVVDLKSNTLYLMAYSYPNSTQTYQLHALNLLTLQDQPDSPVTVSAMGTLTDGSIYNFDPSASRQRAALLEANGNIYAGFASFCDFAASTSRGWLLGWQASSLTPLAANRLNNKLTPEQSPNDFFLSSIWMSGSGVAADAQGNLYFATGNSDPSGTTWNKVTNLSESVIKMSGDLTRVLSSFSPSGVNGVALLDEEDADFGSGGVLLLPNHPPDVPLLTAAGKFGLMYLLNRDQLGGHRAPNAALAVYNMGACWCAETYFTGWDGIGRVVTSGGNYTTDAGKINVWRVQTTSPPALVKESRSPELPASVQDPGFFTSISSNGTSNAIIWAVGRPTTLSPATVKLYAFGPQAAAATGRAGWLFSHDEGTWPHDQANLNTVPVVANGRVYVASYKALAIFGLPSASGAKPSAAAQFVPAAPAPLPLPPDGHEIFGTIKTVAGSSIALATRTGKLIRVDAANAVRGHLSVGLLVGEPVTVYGSYDGSGVLRATSVMHAKHSPIGWPVDR
jgi:hypothetical protein